MYRINDKLTPMTGEYNLVLPDSIVVKLLKFIFCGPPLSHSPYGPIDQLHQLSSSVISLMWNNYNNNNNNKN